MAERGAVRFRLKKDRQVWDGHLNFHIFKRQDGPMDELAYGVWFMVTREFGGQ